MSNLIQLHHLNPKPLLRPAPNLKRHLPILRQLPQHLFRKRLNGHLPDLPIQLLSMHLRDQLLDRHTALAPPRTPLDPGQRLQDPHLALHLGRQLAVDFPGEVRDDPPVSGIPDRAFVRLHDAEGCHPGTELLGHGRSGTQDVVPREHGVVFLEDEAHVVVRVAGSVHGADGGALDGDDLAVGDGLLGLAGVVFVDRGGEVWVEAEEVRDSAGVITVPVSEQDVGERHVGGGERRGNQAGPFWDALAGVDDESSGARAYDVGVCAL